MVIAIAALDSLKANIPGLVNVVGDKNWEAVVEKSLQNVIGGIETGLAGDGALDTLMSTAQLTSLARVFLNQVAATPGMIAGDGQELQSLVAGVVRAMAADTHLLLSGDDWLEIAAVAAEEAAANPGRLFGFDASGPEGYVGEQAIRQILSTTASDLRAARESGQVLFGDTLKQAITTTLRAMAGNAVGAERALSDAKLAALVDQINKLMSVKGAHGAFEYGSKEWLALYGALLSRLLADGNVEAIIGPDNTLTASGQALVEKILAARS